MTEAVEKLINERDGLALGICNGFQALIKLGLVPYGEIETAGCTVTYTHIQYNQPPHLKDGVYKGCFKQEPMACTG